MSQTDNAAAALEWIAQRCSQAQTTSDYEAACAQCAKLARDVLDKKNRDQQVTVRTESKAAVLAHYSDMARVARLEAVNAELVAFAEFVLRGLASGHIKSAPFMYFSNPDASSLEMQSLQSLASAVLAKAGVK